MKLKILDIEIALMEMLDIRNNIIVPNVSWGISSEIKGEWIGGYKKHKVLHECDLISISKSNFGTEYEIKTSKADLKADLKKKHGHKHPLIKRLFYAMPESLIEYAKEILPEDVGLIEVIKMNTGYVSARVIRNSKNRSGFIEWNNSNRVKLLHLSCMCILGLKQKIKKLQGKSNGE